MFNFNHLLLRKITVLLRQRRKRKAQDRFAQQCTLRYLLQHTLPVLHQMVADRTVSAIRTRLQAARQT